MKFKYIKLLLLIVVIGMLQCRKADIKPGIYNVALNDCSGHLAEPYICFDSLIMDSRCPKGVNCVWQGTAQIKVNFHEGGNSHRFDMSLQNFPSLGITSDTIINGYRIRFEDLLPYPDFDTNPSTKKVAVISVTQ